MEEEEEEEEEDEEEDEKERDKEEKEKEIKKEKKKKKMKKEIKKKRQKEKKQKQFINSHERKRLLHLPQSEGHFLGKIVARYRDIVNELTAALLCFLNKCPNIFSGESSPPLALSLLLAAELLLVVFTTMTAAGGSLVPTDSVADPGASNWPRSRRPNGLEKQNIKAVQDDTLTGLSPGSPKGRDATELCSLARKYLLVVVGPLTRCPFWDHSPAWSWCLSLAGKSVNEWKEDVFTSCSVSIVKNRTIFSTTTDTAVRDMTAATHKMFNVTTSGHAADINAIFQFFPYSNIVAVNNFTI
ncbi:hypothetical protein C0J52_15801 [Blattella germanica]|nr:hypothetical protein C0J52_15801 [Blattella germanica]